MVETVQNSERESYPATQDARNPVLYPGHIPVSRSGAMPSLAQPQRAEIAPPNGKSASTPAPSLPDASSQDPSPSEASPNDPSQEASSTEPPPTRRVRALPIPIDEDEPPRPMVIPAPANQTAKPLPEAKLEDSKTVYVVSDIVDALRADAGYEPLPRDPNRVQSKGPTSIWARLAKWLRRRWRS